MHGLASYTTVSILAATLPAAITSSPTGDNRCAVSLASGHSNLNLSITEHDVMANHVIGLQLKATSRQVWGDGSELSHDMVLAVLAELQAAADPRFTLDQLVDSLSGACSSWVGRMMKDNFERS